MASVVLVGSPLDIPYFIAFMSGGHLGKGSDHMATPTFFLNYHP